METGLPPIGEMLALVYKLGLKVRIERTFSSRFWVILEGNAKDDSFSVFGDTDCEALAAALRAVHEKASGNIRKALNTIQGATNVTKDIEELVGITPKGPTVWAVDPAADRQDDTAITFLNGDVVATTSYRIACDDSSPTHGPVGITGAAGVG